MSDKKFWEAKAKVWSGLVEKIVQERFKGDPSWVFSAICRTTKYDQY